MLRNKLTENRCYKLMQLQHHGAGGVRRRSNLSTLKRGSREGHRSSWKPFTQQNVEIVHDLNIQEPSVQIDLGLQSKKCDNLNHGIPSERGKVCRIKVLVSSKELSELLCRDNGERGGDHIESFLFQKLLSNGNDVSFNRSRCQSSGQPWKPSLPDIPEVISW